MRFDTSQHMRLGQQMKLAPHMIQSMEILQMPMMALQERIDQELESNIALEQIEPGDDAVTTSSETEEAEEVERLARRELVVGDQAKREGDDWERLSTLESSYGDAFENTYSSGTIPSRRLSGERDRKLDAMANVAARGETLIEQLQRQWSFTEVDPAIKAVGQRLLNYVNDDGLLGADLPTILEQNRNVPGVTLTLPLLETALREIQQQLDPPGVGARDHRECMLIQIDRMQAEPALMPLNGEAGAAASWPDVRLLIREHYDDLLQNRLPRIAQRTGWEMPRIHAAIALMRKLNLNPGRELIEDEPPPILPDAIVEYDEQADAYIARLSDGTLPRLRISQHYEQMAKDRKLDKPTREFVSGNVRSAAWLIDAIEQRKSTLLRVINVVLARQREFFDHGPQHLKPLPMIEVADQLGVHVATVSRAVADKWIATPRGTFPLRKFFSGGTETDSGRDMSWDAVKATLKEIVDHEDKSKPFNDDELAAELKKQGIEIARRTVVKYRQQLDIPPARRRKVY